MNTSLEYRPPLILEPEELHAARDADWLLLTVCQPQVYLAHHVPGSLLVQPGELLSGVEPATGKLPAAARLSELFSRLGLEPGRHVVAIDDEGGGWAGRLIWTLDVLGHQSHSFLNGGVLAWAAAGLPLESGSRPSAPRNYEARVDRAPIADRQQVLAGLHDPDSIVWDARSWEEYAGLRATARRNGHIPGAVHLDWLKLMDRERHCRLQPPHRLRELLAERGLAGGKKIVTHCHTHHRSGLSYLVGKALGLNIRAYDGSWSEWGNSTDTPIKTQEPSQAAPRKPPAVPRDGS